MFPADTRILIVDDSSTSREIMKKAVMTLGFKDLQFAEDGEAAVQIITRSIAEGAPIGLVIADIRMPRMDGLQLLNFVRKTCVPADLPFLLVTAEGDNQTVLQAIHARVSGYVRKPFNPKMIEERLEKMWQAQSKSHAS